jgi:hypothetical protein
MKYLFLLLFFFLLTNSVFAQELRGDRPRPGRTFETSAPKSYPDSAEFIKIFKQLYPKIKPAQTVREFADQQFKAMSRTFKMQGIDSAEAAKAAFAGLDDSAFYKIYFDIFRRNLSAKELKKYIEFISTPEGQHIIEVIPDLQRALPDANMYVARTMNLNLTPIRQAAREKMEKEQPPKKPIIKPQAPKVDMFDEKNAGSKDSLMHLRKGQDKIPQVKIPGDTTSH